MDDQGSRLEEGLGTCVIVLLPSQSVSLLPPFLLSFHLPFCCHLLGAFFSALPSFMTLIPSQSLIKTGAFSLHRIQTLPMTFQAWLLKCNSVKKTDEKSIGDHFSRHCPGLQGTFLTALSYLHIRSRISPSSFYSQCNKWFPLVINSNLPSADGYFRSISVKLMSSCI